MMIDNMVVIIAWDSNMIMTDDVVRMIWCG